MGPTASGKTNLAIELLAQFPCEIISVDSAMVYKGMDIGTAKPTQDILSKAPHRLINLIDPSESYSVGQFYEDVQREIEDIIKNGKVPLLVGGTMMYFNAIQNGLAELPESDPVVREKLTAIADEKGIEYLHKQLEKIDPVSAERIHPNDPQRLLRALEVYEQTGKTVTELWDSQTRKGLPYHFINIAIAHDDRSVLHDRIASRFDTMLSNGFIKEVEALYARQDLTENHSSIRTVGYRQAWDFCAGKLTRDEMRERAIIATRQFAKRQYTWLRGWPNLTSFDSSGPALTQKVAVLLIKRCRSNRLALSPVL